MIVLTYQYVNVGVITKRVPRLRPETGVDF